MVLRVDHARDEAVLTLPRSASLKEGLAFAEERRDWLSRRLASLPPRVPFAPDAVIPLRGEPHTIRHADATPRRSGVVRVEAGEIRVAGKPEHLARRVADWLKAEAKRALEPLARDKAARDPPRHGARHPHALGLVLGPGRSLALLAVDPRPARGRRLRVRPRSRAPGGARPRTALLAAGRRTGGRHGGRAGLAR